MVKLKPIDYRILAELVENSKISDRKLASKLGVSQPTVTRRRASLERRGLVSYTTIPDFEKLDLEIMGLIFVAWRPEVRLDERSTDTFFEKARAFIDKNPDLVFVSSGQGLQKDGLAVSFHEDYGDFVTFKRKFEEEWGRYMTSMESFLVSMRNDNVLRSPSPKYLGQLFRKRALSRAES